MLNTRGSSSLSHLLPHGSRKTEDDVLTYVVKACLIIAIIFTYPMQLFPVTEIFDFIVFRKSSEGLFNIKVFFSLLAPFNTDVSLTLVMVSVRAGQHPPLCLLSVHSRSCLLYAFLRIHLWAHWCPGLIILGVHSAR